MNSPNSLAAQVRRYDSLATAHLREAMARVAPAPVTPAEGEMWRKTAVKLAKALSETRGQLADMTRQMEAERRLRARAHERLDADAADAALGAGR